MEKRKGCSVGYGWEGLPPEVLSLIFVRLPWEQLVKVVPLVCRSWRSAVAEPCCWREIDIEEWCRSCNNSTRIDTAVKKLVRKSRGTFRKLCAYKLGNAFYTVANTARCLEVLRIPMSEVSDKIVEQFAQELKTLRVLDISYCLNITHRGLEALGRHCKCLVHLRRNLPPPMVGEPHNDEGEAKDEGEAMAVANHMPGLERLELGYGRFTDRGLDAILTNCRGLLHLNIQGCWNVELEGDLEERCELINFFMGPRDFDLLDEEQQQDDSSGDGSGSDTGLSSDSGSYPASPTSDFW